MNCTDCDTALPLKARFCPSCGTRVKWWEESADEVPGQTASPLHDDGELRARLIDCYLNFSMSKELSEWLENLGLPSTGTTQEKLTRLRRHSDSLVLPAESFPRQTIYYLNKYDEEVLTEICQELGICSTGPQDVLLTRIYRVVGLREGWLQPLSDDARLIITETFIPILKGFDPNKDYYRNLWDELTDVLDEDSRQLHGAHAYGSAIIAVLVPGFFQEAQVTLLQNEIKERAEKRSPSRPVQFIEPAG
jgi:hypothetical protein